MSRLARFAWGVTVWNVLVVAWGAYVRATGSGAGCGSHWPLCNGEVVPRAPRLETLIELSHRLTSGIALVLVIALAVAVFRSRPRGHRARRAVLAATGLILFEAALGAALVLFGLVADDASLARALVMGLHLVSTFLLLAALALTALRADETAPAGPAERRVAVLLGIGLGGLIVVGASGGIAALGDTLFPSASLGEGLRADLSPTAHLLIRLRILHPLLAVTVTAWLMVLPRMIDRRGGDGTLRRRGALVSLVALGQLAIGAINVGLLAPVAMQLVHLVVADILWIALVAYADRALRHHATRPFPQGTVSTLPARPLPTAD